MVGTAWWDVGISPVSRDKAGAVGPTRTRRALWQRMVSQRSRYREAVKGQSVVGAPAPVFVPIVIGRLGRGDGGTSAPSIDQHLIVEQRRHPGTMQVPFQITSQRTDEQVHAHSAFLAMVARSQASAGILRADELGQVLFVEKRQLQRLAFDQSAGLHHSQRTPPPERRMTLDLFGPDLCQRTPVADQHSPVEAEVFAQLHDLAGDGVWVGGFSRIRLDRHRKPARDGQHRIDDLRLAALAVAVVSETHQRTGAPFVVAAAHVDEHWHAFVQMALGAVLFDAWLAYEQPVHSIVEVVLVGITVVESFAG